MHLISKYYESRLYCRTRLIYYANACSKMWKIGLFTDSRHFPFNVVRYLIEFEMFHCGYLTKYVNSIQLG